MTLLPRAVVAAALAQRRIAAHALPAAQARVATVFVRRRDAFASSALLRFPDFARQDRVPSRLVKTY